MRLDFTTIASLGITGTGNERLTEAGPHMRAPTEENSPLGQTVHLACAYFGLNFPTAQSLQDCAFAPEYWPGEHSMQNVEALFVATLPRLQRLHEVWPDMFWKRPLGHTRHEVSGSVALR